MRRLYGTLILLLILTACGRPQSQPPTPEPKNEPAQVPMPAPAPQNPAPAADLASSSRLLPQADGVYTFYLQEGYRGQSRPVEEEWVREGDRLLATQGGRPYVSWLLASDGVWRADPKNPKVLLRYLPPDLRDELAWRQQSGDEWVWFRLRSASEPSEWVLTVVNRGERTDWHFRNGYQEVAAESLSSPEGAFHKEGGGGQPAPIGTERRAAILAAAPVMPTQRAPLEQVSRDSFLSTLKRLGYDSHQADFDGDGQNELFVGALDRPTWFRPELLSKEGYVITEAQYYSGGATVTLANLGGRPRLLVQSGMMGGTLQIVWFKRREGGGWVSWVAAEIGPKLIGWTPATHTQLLPDGRLQVEWEPANDPAGHRQVRHLRMTAEGKVEWLDSAWEARAGSLRDPQTPRELLQAFFFTQWFGLQEEAKRYLARPEMAAAFPVKGQPTAFVTEGTVEIGRVEAQCKPVKMDLPASGPIPFFAEIGGYEGGTTQSGTAQVGRASDGRLVLESIQLAEPCWAY